MELIRTLLLEIGEKVKPSKGINLNIMRLWLYAWERKYMENKTFQMHFLFSFYRILFAWKWSFYWTNKSEFSFLMHYKIFSFIHSEFPFFMFIPIYSISKSNYASTCLRTAKCSFLLFNTLCNYLHVCARICISNLGLTYLSSSIRFLILIESHSLFSHDIEFNCDFQLWALWDCMEK